MKRRKLLKNKTASYIAASILTLALAGITCGTFAWFNYDTRTPVSELNGTAIGLNELEAGFLSEVELDQYEQYGLVKDDSNPDEVIYWVKDHQIKPETINYVLSSNGYATNTLYPVSTLKYSKGDDFNLYSAPDAFSKGNEFASKDNSVQLSLVFRYRDLLSDELSYISNENIYLSKFSLKTEEENTLIHRAVRIYSDNRDGSQYLINPTASDDGSNVVGGILDLDGDGFYDCTENNGLLFEKVYGQTNDFSYKDAPESEDTLVPESDKTTFYSSHRSGTYALDEIIPEVAEYEGFYEFRNRRKCVTTTNPNTNNLAYLDLSIFVEGWDLNVIDSQIGMQFSIELTFDTAL